MKARKESGPPSISCFDAHGLFYMQFLASLLRNFATCTIASTGMFSLLFNPPPSPVCFIKDKACVGEAVDDNVSNFSINAFFFHRVFVQKCEKWSF
jgi:hypothetical protein